MTKRRPSWSDRLRWVAAFVCGLLLLNGSPAVWAANKKPPARPVVGKSVKAVAGRTVTRPSAVKASKKTKKNQRAARATFAEVGQADIIESESVGLKGSASFYGHGFRGRKTSTGESFDVRKFTAASNHFPLGSMVAVRRLDNDLCAIVKVNDRMHAKHRQRVIDVSRGVAEYLEMLRAGVVLVRVAAMKHGWERQGMAACHAAFELEKECLSCGRPPRLPEIGTEAPGRE